MRAAPLRSAPLLAALLFPGAAWGAGDVEIKSSPSGAEILVDGQPTGQRTPATLKDLDDGARQVLVRKGCQAARTTVQVAPGTTPVVDLELLAQDGTMELQIQPTTASVLLDGAPLEWSPGVPQVATCGAHTLKVWAKGYETALVDIEVGAAENKVVALTLDELGVGRLEIDVAPVDATVWLNERKLGTGPRLVEVTAGPHAIRAGLEGYEDQERQIVVEVDETLPVAFSLQPVAKNTTVIVDGGRKRRPWLGLTVAGLGVAGIAWGTTEYLQGQSGWDEFNDRKGKIEDGLWPDAYDDDPAAWAYDVYDTSVKGHRTRMLIGDVVGGVLLTSGLVLTFAL